MVGASLNRLTLSRGSPYAAASEETVPAGLWEAAFGELVLGEARVVGILGDEVVNERWARGLSTCPWLHAGDSDTTHFHHNLDNPLLDQLLAAAPRRADQLLIGAPFFDEDAEVVTTLVDELAPHEVICHLGQNASVDGEALVRALSRVRRVHYFRPDPDAYVHAKLIAIV
jgi:hypothetical protein